MKVLRWYIPYSKVLHLSLVFAVVPWLYNYINEEHRKQSYSMEESVMRAWDKIIAEPRMFFQRAVIGFVTYPSFYVSKTKFFSKLSKFLIIIVEKRFPHFSLLCAVF